jgi:hypothetical protein
MKKKILQYFANLILDLAKKAMDDNDSEAFHKIYNFGDWYDTMCVYYFDVYLD